MIRIILSSWDAKVGSVFAQPFSSSTPPSCLRKWCPLIFGRPFHWSRCLSYHLPHLGQVVERLKAPQSLHFCILLTSHFTPLSASADPARCVIMMSKQAVVAYIPSFLSGLEIRAPSNRYDKMVPTIIMTGNYQFCFFIRDALCSNQCFTNYFNPFGLVDIKSEFTTNLYCIWNNVLYSDHLNEFERSILLLKTQLQLETQVPLQLSSNATI